MDFGSLQRIKTRKSTHCGGSTSRYVPPSGFGYPLGGLLLPSPCRVCFAPTALLGFTLRSVPLSKGIRTSPPGRTHMPFFRPVPPSPKRQPVPEGRGSWALTLSRVPYGRVACLTRPAAGCSPGFCPFQGVPARTFPGSLPGSSHALSRPAPGGVGRRRLRVSIGSRLALPVLDGKPSVRGTATLLGFSHRSAPEHSDEDPFELCVHFVPRRALLPTDQHSLKEPNALSELFRIG